MTDKELKKLSRSDLLNILIQQSEEIEKLKRIIDSRNKTIADYNEKLKNKELLIDNAGSIAEASLEINNIFAKAQEAADQYLENVQSLTSQKYNQLIEREIEAKKKNKEIIEQAQEKATEIINQAQDEAEAYWNDVTAKLDDYMDKHSQLRNVLSVDFKRAE